MWLFGTEYYRRITAEEIVQKMIEGGLTSLDPHSSFMNARERAEMNTRFKGEFGGLGIEIQKNKTGPGILVVTPMDDTPAARAGVKAQDVIIRVDGQSVLNKTIREAVELLRGEAGSTVTLVIVRKGEPEPISLILTRAVIKMQFVKYELKDGGVGMVRITSFAEPVEKLVREAVAKLKAKNGGRLSGFVLDLRNNPGGLLGVADDINNLFLDGRRYDTDPEISIETGCAESRVTISTESRGEISPEYCVVSSKDIVEGIPMVILINKGSASASEIVSGVLQKYGRAVIAGTSVSFGKGTVQMIRTLRTGGALSLTTSQYLIGPKGCEQVIQNKGVTPDLFIEDPAEKVAGNEETEAELPDAVASSTVSNENCKYHYSLPEGHMEAARGMLEKLGFNIVNK